MLTIGVVIPLYNKESSIERALQSVFSQRRKADKIIIVDDASTDSSLHVVQSLMDDINIELIELPDNSGVSHARNAGIAACDSDYVCFLDADDYWLPDFLVEVESVLIKNENTDLVATAYKYATNNGFVSAKTKASQLSGKVVKIDDYFAWASSGDLPITASSVCVRRDSLKQEGGFNESLLMGEDQLLWSRISYMGSMLFIKRELAVYDIVAANSACFNGDKTRPSPYLSMIKGDVGTGLAPQRLHASILRYIDRGYKYAALHCLIQGRMVLARSYLRSLTFSNDAQAGVMLAITFLPAGMASWLCAMAHNFVNKKNRL